MFFFQYYLLILFHVFFIYEVSAPVTQLVDFREPLEYAPCGDCNWPAVDERGPDGHLGRLHLRLGPEPGVGDHRQGVRDLLIGVKHCSPLKRILLVITLCLFGYL